MREYQVALIPGDGIGHEVCPEGVKVITAVGELLGDFRITYETFAWGCEYYLRHGEMMAKEALRILEPFDAIYFGAVGFPSVPETISRCTDSCCRYARASNNTPTCAPACCSRACPVR
jgi:tartrate dehydrogenase/decarboxylase/D-malate dehydrogenase